VNRRSNQLLEQILELLHAEASFVKNLPKRPRAKTTMVRHNHSRCWIIATKNHVTIFLPPKYESDSFKRPPKIISRNIRRELHLASGGSQLDILAAIFLRNRITGSETIFNVKIYRFLDIGQRLFLRVAL
jgi:hypothetical protein